jgi:hypothetical protein
MMKYLQILLVSATAILACNSPVTKKVLIMGRGSIKTNGNDISMTDGTGYAEETIEVSGDKQETRNVTTSTGKSTIEIPGEEGFYVLNLKADTIVGSQQIFGTDISTNRVITQEELKKNIDSLTKLTTGENISAAGHNYMILPNEVKKISANAAAKVFGPFTKIPATLEADKNGKAPEIYKFYTNGEIRQLIAGLKKKSY